MKKGIINTYSGLQYATDMYFLYFKYAKLEYQFKQQLLLYSFYK